MRRATLALAGFAAVALAAGCSSSHSQPQDDPVVSSPAASTEASYGIPGSPSASHSVSVGPSSYDPSAPNTHPPSIPPTHAHSSHVTAPPIVQRSTCTKLTIRAIPGGASVGQEIAALQFTNDGNAPCQLFGYPSVTLLRQGRPLGKPSLPATSGVSHRTLAPGETAESLLRDFVGNCQAPLSDAVRVVAPGSTKSFSRPFVMRGCVLRVDRLGAPD